MNICIFDTETIGIDKPFCYNIGYVIVDTNTWELLLSRSYVVEQIWHNLPLFKTAYYADKRPIYVNEMRSRKTIMSKYGYICQQMIRDFDSFQVENAYAFNSSFDERVFDFNCDWFKCNNPFDTIKIHDIRAFAIKYLVDDDYKLFCDTNGLYTESGNYSTTAETFYKYISSNTAFIESHTALEDSLIETEVLYSSISNGAKLEEEIIAPKSVEKIVAKELQVIARDKTEHTFPYNKIRINKEKTKIVLH